MSIPISEKDLESKYAIVVGTKLFTSKESKKVVLVNYTDSYRELNLQLPIGT